METRQAKTKQESSLKTRAKTAIVISSFIIVYVLLLLFSSWQWFDFNENPNIRFILNFFNLLMIVVLLFFVAREIATLNNFKKGLFIYTVISMFVVVATSCLYLLISRSFFDWNDITTHHFKHLISINLLIWGSILIYIVNQIIILILHKKDKLQNKLTVFWYPFLTFFLSLFFNVFFYVGLIHLWSTFLFLIIISIGADLFGYVFGIKFGKHKLAPKISPKKSWEGLISSYLLTIFVVCCIISIFYFIPSLGHYKTMYTFIGCQCLAPDTGSTIPPYFWAIYIASTIVLITISVLGDLFFSYIKRRFKIKDFSNLLPGHGGILDRLDALSFIFILYFAITIICQLATTGGTEGMKYLWLGKDLQSLV